MRGSADAQTPNTAVPKRDRASRFVAIGGRVLAFWGTVAGFEIDRLCSVFDIWLGRRPRAPAPLRIRSSAGALFLRRPTYDAGIARRPTIRRFRGMDSHSRDMPSTPCPRCRRSMKLVRTIPKLGALSELLIFSCPNCGEVETKEAKQAA
jgi:hypothetical protein